MVQNDIPQRVKNAVCRLEPEAVVILYGSRARNTPQPDSDWDFLVLLDGPIFSSRVEAIRDLLYDLELETEQIISAIIRDRREWDRPPLLHTPLHHNVEREGRRL